MDNIDSVLKAHGSSIKYAVKFNVYVRPLTPLQLQLHISPISNISLPSSFLYIHIVAPTATLALALALALR